MARQKGLQDLLAKYGSSPVPRVFNPVWVAFSYVISLLGTWTAVELLNRRTSTRGFYNWFLLLSASVAMGGVAIWSMHFIGNTAISLGDSTNTVKLMYDPCLIILSLLLPILVMTAAFLVFSFRAEPTSWNIVLGGILTGSAIVGMHYLGYRGIKNFTVASRKENIAGACLIAISAASISLGLLFRFKSKWNSHVWKRFVCAAILAVASSMMHWVAVLGTDFFASPKYEGSAGGISTTMAGLMCGILAALCCGILIGLALLWRIYVIKAQRCSRDVLLGLCMWDPEGRIMLNQAGLLPTTSVKKICFDDVRDDYMRLDHPVFAWIYRVSRHWESILPLVGYMRRHLDALREDEGLEREMTSGCHNTRLFREQFCVAAARLAEQTDIPLHDIGVLYTRTITTGTMKRVLFSFSSPTTPQGGIRDTESVAETTELQGTLLFLVRHGSRPECERLAAKGFAFAPLVNVISNLARHGQMPTPDLVAHMQRLERYRPSVKILSPGISLAFYCIKPSVRQSFNVLVDCDNPNVLPCTQVKGTKKASKRHFRFFAKFSDQRASEMMSTLKDIRRDSSRDHFDRDFAQRLLLAMEKLSDAVSWDLFKDSVLTTPHLYGSCSYCVDDGHQITRAPFFAFRRIRDVHTREPKGTDSEFMPHSLFVAQQRSCPYSPDLASFAGSIYREFADLASQYGRNDEPEVEIPIARLSAVDLLPAVRDENLAEVTTIGSRPEDGPSKTDRLRLDVRRSSHRSRTTQQSDGQSLSAPTPGAGILVSSELHFDVEDQRRLSWSGRKNTMGGIPMGVTDVSSVVSAIEGGAAQHTETETFAEKLFKITLKDHVVRGKEHRLNCTDSIKSN